MPTLPLVSILIPAYHERYFRQAFQSALAQTYPNIEIVISDDSPGDSTRRYVEEGQWPVPVRYQFNPDRHDRGHSNFNRCFRMAQGEYIKFLCDDDLLAPNCVERMMTALLEHPEATLATSPRQRIDADGQPLDNSEATLPPITEDALVDGPSLCRAVLTAMVNCIGEPTVPLFHRSALDCSGGDILTYAGHWPGSLSDVAMWFSALRQGHCVYLAAPLSSFRVHGSQDQQADETRVRSLADYKLLCRLARDTGLIDGTTAEHLNQRNRWIPGWAKLRHRPLTGGDWQESFLYFGPERVTRGATSARLDEGGYTEATDYFLLEGQFECDSNSASVPLAPSRSTRQCTRLWSQLLVDQTGNGRPCPRFEKTHNIYAGSTNDGLEAARFTFLIGQPQGPCTDCDLFPLVPLQNFIHHNFAGQKNLTSPHTAQVLVPDAEGTSVRPAHILVVGHSAGRAGGEFVALSLVRALREQGIRVTLILARGGELEEDFRNKADVYLVGQELSDTTSIRTLLAKLRLEGVRHAICNTVTVGRYATWLKELGYQVLHLVHELGTSIERFLPTEDRQGICIGPDTIIFPARFVEQSFLERYAPRSTQLLRHAQGIEPDFERPADRSHVRTRLRNTFSLPADARLVIGAGSGELRKGPDLFLQVARQVLSDPADLHTHFIWVGKLDVEFTSWIEHDCRTLGLEDRFHLAGLRSDLTDFYLGADLFLMTSREDPLPNVVIEAMYAGLPIIAFADSGGTPELLDGGCGCVVPYLDTAAMAKATRELLESPASTTAIGTHAARRIETGFRRKDYLDFLLSQFRQAIHRVTLVLPGANPRQLSRQLASLEEALAGLDWRPDHLILPCAPETLRLPPSLASIGCSRLNLPVTTPVQEQLRQATSQAETELLWYLDAPLARLDPLFLGCLSSFDAPQVVMAGGPGHDPTSRESLPTVPSTLLAINERHWLQYQWPNRDGSNDLERSTPLLFIGSLVLRRAPLARLLANSNFLIDNPLWFWPLLTALGRVGTLAWTPRPVIQLDLTSLPFPENGKNWWLWWNNAQAAARAPESPPSPKAELDLLFLKDKLGIKAITAEIRALHHEAPPILDPRDEMSHYELACNRLDKGELNEAEALLSSLAQRGSTLWQVYFDLGRIAFEREQTDTAIEHFRTAAGLEFSSTHALRNLIAIYTMTGEYGAALAATGLTLRRESDPELQAHLQAIVTEANVNLDNLDWASPRWASERHTADTNQRKLEQQLQEARHTIAQLDRKLLVAQAGSLPRPGATAPGPRTGHPRRPLCIVHLGMPKTGSTAIQTALAQSIRDPRLAYANLPGICHEEICSLFADAPERYHSNVRQGLRGAALEACNREARAALVKGFTEHHCDMELISCEGIYHLSRQGLERLKDFLQPYFDQITVVGYVRPPRSFMESAFQELVKYFDLDRFDFSSIYHPYRKLEVFDQVFGRERVQLWKFDTAAFPGGDVVQDFCHRLGITPQAGAPSPVNEALSQEAVAALFAFNRHGHAGRFGERRFALVDNLVHLLADIGQNRFRFADSLMDQVMADYSDDLAWIESRLGQSLQEPRRDAGIDSEAALLQVAAAAIPTIRPLLDVRHLPPQASGTTPEAAAALLDALLDQIAAEQDGKRN